MRRFNNKGKSKESNNSPSPKIIKSPDGVMSGSLWNPFTYAQLRELERQIMIYKYFMACVSVPSYLLSSTPTSSSSTSNSTDPMEGRCRRTDGKKWRCYKYATPNNKYCQRHMHRGCGRSRKSAELCINHTENKSSRFLASITSNPYLQPSVSFDNPSFGVKLAPSSGPSNMQPTNMQPRMLNGDPMFLGASNSGWHNGDPMFLGTSNSGWHNNTPVNQYKMSLPQYNILMYNPLLVYPQSEKPRGIICNSSASAYASVDQSMMGPLGEMLGQCNVISTNDSTNAISTNDSTSANSSSPVTSNPVESVRRSGT